MNALKLATAGVTTEETFVTMKTQAACRRAQEAQRAALIEALGMEPEGDRYAADTHELLRWVNEDRGPGLPKLRLTIFTVAH